MRFSAIVLGGLLAASGAQAQAPAPAPAPTQAPVQAPAPPQAASVVYRCPGNVYTSDRELSPAQAEQRGCRAIEGTPITIVQGAKPRPAVPGPAAAAAPAARSSDARIDAATQRARDTDARRILGEELRREEERLAELKREYNNGEPDRRGDERNYQRYLDRVADMKAGIARKEADIAALKRELAKLPS